MRVAESAEARSARSTVGTFGASLLMAGADDDRRAGPRPPRRAGLAIRAPAHRRARRRLDPPSLARAGIEARARCTTVRGPDELPRPHRPHRVDARPPHGRVARASPR